jgi:hypothetical protein
LDLPSRKSGIWIHWDHTIITQHFAQLLRYILPVNSPAFHRCNTEVSIPTKSLPSPSKMDVCSYRRRSPMSRSDRAVFSRRCVEGVGYSCRLQFTIPFALGWINLWKTGSSLRDHRFCLVLRESGRLTI